MMHSFYLQLSNTWWVYLSPEIQKIGIQGLQTAFHFLQPNLTCAFTICTQGCRETVYILYTLAYLFRLLCASTAGWRIKVKKKNSSSVFCWDVMWGLRFRKDQSSRPNLFRWPFFKPSWHLEEPTNIMRAGWCVTCERNLTQHMLHAQYVLRVPGGSSLFLIDL